MPREQDRSESYQAQHSEATAAAPPESRSSDWTDELETLLSLAEEFQDKCERMSTRIAMFRLGELLALGLAVALLTGWSDRILSDGGFSFHLRITGGIVAAYALMTEIAIVRRLIRRRNRDQRALAEIVDILRETDRSMADTGKWSQLQRGKFRIRLSRFDIGADSVGGPSWVRTIGRLIDGQ